MNGEQYGVANRLAATVASQPEVVVGPRRLAGRSDA